MKRFVGLAIIAGVLGSRCPVSAQANWTFNHDYGPAISMRGFQIDSPGLPAGDSDTTPYGFLFTFQGAPVMSYGITKPAASAPTTTDFFLYSHALSGSVLDIRSDNAQTSIGPGVSSNHGVRQMELTAGTPSAPLSGMAVTTYGGAKVGLALLQSPNPPVGGTATKRVQINLNDMFRVGTDAWNSASGTGDPTNYFVADISSGNTSTWRYPFVIQHLGGTTANQTDAVVLGMNANDQIGFFGAGGTTRPVITGSRSDGTALANLLQKLQAMGLITDQTTP